MDLNDLLKEIKEKENIEDILKDSALKETSNDNIWLLFILMILLFDFPKKEEQKPTITIYVNGGVK